MTLWRTPPLKTRKKKKMLPLLQGEIRKGRPPQLGAEGSKKGRTLLLDSSTAADEGEDEWLPRAKPLGRS